jgi:hypothetical protein
MGWNVNLVALCWFTIIIGLPVQCKKKNVISCPPDHDNLKAVFFTVYSYCMKSVRKRSELQYFKILSSVYRRILQLLRIIHSTEYKRKPVIKQELCEEIKDPNNLYKIKGPNLHAQLWRKWQAFNIQWENLLLWNPTVHEQFHISHRFPSNTEHLDKKSYGIVHAPCTSDPNNKL